jgi:uncharacterized repeat protein (TIGR02543 family)
LTLLHQSLHLHQKKPVEAETPAAEETAAPVEETAVSEETVTPEATAEPAPTPEATVEPQTPAPEETAAAAEETAAPEETAVPEETAEPEATPEATPEEETETVTYMAAKSETRYTGQMAVTVSWDDHTFPEGTTLEVTDVSRSDAIAAAEQSTEGDEEVIDAVAVDITFYNAAGEEIQPERPVSVSMVPYTPLETTDTSTVEVLHQEDDGNTETVSADVSAESASFEAEKFSIYVIKSTDDPKIATYIFHDAIGNVTSTQKVKNGETVYAPTTPEKSGYKFIGWYYKQNDQTVELNAFEKLTASVSSTGKVNLYPVFQQAYYVFFLDNQGRVSTTKEGVSGDTISVSDVKIPLDSTHSVTGWYTANPDNPEQEGAEKVEFVTLADHNVTLYPKVEEGHYLYFATGEGATYIEPEFVAANASTTKPDEPMRPGYTFKYWSTSEGGSEYSFPSTITKDTTLYAVWTANNTNYTVIYWWENANDDNYSFHQSEKGTGETGQTVDISNIKKTYDGFTLNKDKTNTANSSTTIAGDGSTIINVYYDRNEYQVKFFYFDTRHWVQDGWWLSDGHWEGDNTWKEYSDLTITAKYGANIADKWPSSTSKIWGKTQGRTNGSQPYQSGISTMPLGGESFYYVDQSGDYTMNLNYYLEGFTEGNYSYDHTDSFKTYNPKDWSTSAEDHYDIEGFTYTNNVEDHSYFNRVGSTNTYEVNFQYSRNSYNINLINGDKKLSQTHKYEADLSKVKLPTELEKPTGVTDGYSFVGWYDNELCVGDPVKLPSTMPAHDITLYAKWVPNTYKGTIHLTINGTETLSIDNIDYGSTISENDMPIVKDSQGNIIEKGNGKDIVTVPAGYEWEGWATKVNDAYVLYNFNTKVYGDIVLYPYYINTTGYRVTYMVGEGSGTPPTDKKKYAENSYADIQSAYGIIPPKGKTFLYWETRDHTKYYPGDKVKITGGLTLTAIFGDVSPTTSIIYESNYPTDSGLKNISITVDGKENNAAIKLVEAEFPVPNGYYFAEWKDAKGQKYPVGTKIGIDNTSENHLYAVWEKKKEIILEANTVSVPYDGKPHTASGVKTDTFTFNNGAEVYTVGGYTTSNPTSINVCSNVPNTISGTLWVKDKDQKDVTEKFTITKKDGSLTITPAAEVTITITGNNGRETYDGTEKTVSGFTTSDLPTGITLDLAENKTAEAKGTNAGEYPMGLTQDSFVIGGTDNYTKVNVNVVDGKLTITPAEATVQAHDASKVYGTDDPKFSATVTGIIGSDQLEYTINRAEGENVGTYALTPNGEENQGNYHVTYLPGTLTITKAAAVSITITGNSLTTRYNGEVQTVSGVVVTGGPVKTSNVKAAFSNLFTTMTSKLSNLVLKVNAEGTDDTSDEKADDQNSLVTVVDLPVGINVTLKEGVTASLSEKDAGTYAMGLTKDSFDITGTENYDSVEVIVVDGVLTIEKAPLTVITYSAEKDYDGKPLTAGGRLEGIVDPEVKLVTFSTTGSQTDPGSSVNGYEIHWGDDVKSSNYSITKQLGTLKVHHRKEKTSNPTSSAPAPKPASTNLIPRTSAEGPVEEAE